MSEKALQFSRNLKIEEIDGKSFRVFNTIEKFAFSLKIEYNETKSSVRNVFFDTNIEIKLKDLFTEALNQMILTALTFHIKTVIFENLPINQASFNKIFKKFKLEYENNINIAEIEFDSTKCIKRIVIQIQLPRNTHYIQQAYLRNFSTNNEMWKGNNQKDNARIFVFNKYRNILEKVGNTSIEKKYGQKIRSVAKKDYFYSLAMEQLMRKVYETKIPPIFNKLIRNPKINILTEEEVKFIVDYILLTWQRTVKHRKSLEEMWVKMGRIFAEDYKGKKIDSNIKIEVNPKYIKRIHEEMMVGSLAPNSDSHELLSHKLLNLRWKIIKTKFPYTFLTSDNPVIFYNSFYEKEKKKGNDFIVKQIEDIKNHKDFNRGIGFIEVKGELGKAPMNKGIEIYLPISPNICLCLYDNETTKKLLTPQKINRETILQAEKYIYSNHKRINFISKIISRNPYCVDRDGKRNEIKASFKEIIKQLEP